MASVKRVNGHTAECMFSEEEIRGMGFSFDGLVKQGGNETQRFMELMFTLAGNSIGIRRDLVPEQAHFEFYNTPHGRALHAVLSWKKQDTPEDSGDIPALPGIYAPQGASGQASQEGQKEQEKQGNAEGEAGFTMAVVFHKLDEAIQFSKAAMPYIQQGEIYTGLSKQGEEYWMLLDSADAGSRLQASLILVASEFGGEPSMDKMRIVRLCECGKAIIEEGAAERLAEL